MTSAGQLPLCHVCGVVWCVVPCVRSVVQFAVVHCGVVQYAVCMQCAVRVVGGVCGVQCAVQCAVMCCSVCDGTYVLIGVV